MNPNDPNLPQLQRIAVALGELREQLVFVASTFAALLAQADFMNVLPGLIAEPERAGVVLARLREMCCSSANHGSTINRVI